MAGKPERKTEGGLLARLGFSGWMLLSVGLVMLALHLCRNQGTFQNLSEWDFFLRNAGTVILLSESDALKSTAAEGALIRSWDEFESVKQAARTGNAEALVSAMNKAGSRLIIVGTDLRQSGAAPPDSVLMRLAELRSVEGFHALMIRPEGALYEAAPPLDLSMEQMTRLVELVRKELASPEPKPAAPGADEEEGEGDWEVAVQLQGLEPTVVDKKNIYRIRQDLFASGRSSDLETAALKAAAEIKRAYGETMADSGPLAQAMDRLRIELHVLYDFTLVQHLRGEMDSGAYWAYMDEAFEPGVHGVYINRLGPAKTQYLFRPRARFRLPSDAVYWMRTSGKKIVERIVRDAGLGGTEALADKKEITVDRFRTLHVIEAQPGGRVLLAVRGLPVVPPEEVNAESALSWGDGAARWLEKSLRPDGAMAVGYLPDRDSETLEKPADLTFDASRHLLAAMAFMDAFRLTGKSQYDTSFEKTLPVIHGWIRACPGAAAASKKKPLLDQGQILDVCGPLQRDGKAVAVEAWGQGGKNEKPVPDDLVMLFANTRAGTQEAALAGLLLIEEIQRRAQTRTEKAPDALVLLKGIVSFILFMQKEDGSFQSYFVSPNNAFYRGESAYGGLSAVMLLVAARDLVKDKRLDGALEKATGYYTDFLAGKIEALEAGMAAARKDRDAVRTIAWAIMALSRAGLALQDAARSKEVVTAALAFAGRFQIGPEPDPDLAGGFVVDERALPDYESIFLTIGLLTAARLADSLGLEAEREKLVEAGGAGMRFAAQLQLRAPGGTSFVPNPQRTDGGVRQSPLILRQRIDFAAAMIGACSAFVQSLQETGKP
jgi:hypothetical protein